MQNPFTKTLWTALVTPLNGQGKVDDEALKTLLRRQDQAGIGQLLLGSTGEGAALPLSEKKRIVELAKSLKLSEPLMVGVGGFDLPTQIDWVRFCNSMSVDAYLLVTPPYAKPGPVGQYQWFSAIMDEAQAPCMLYNHPGRSAISLSLETAKKLGSHPNFGAIKEASAQDEVFTSFKQALPHIPLFVGNDDKLFDAIRLGGRGLIGVMSNVWPDATRAYLDLCLNQKKDEHFEILYKASLLSNRSNPLAAKWLLYKKGLIKSPETLPPLSIEDLSNKEEVLSSDEMVSRLEESLLITS